MTEKKKREFLCTALEFLDQNGWSVLRIGNITVEKRPREHDFRLVIDFTGKKRAAKGRKGAK